MSGGGGRHTHSRTQVGLVEAGVQGEAGEDVRQVILAKVVQEEDEAVLVPPLVTPHHPHDLAQGTGTGTGGWEKEQGEGGEGVG